MFRCNCIILNRYVARCITFKTISYSKLVILGKLIQGQLPVAMCA